MSTYLCTLPRKLYNLLCLFIDLGAFFFSKMSFKKTSNTPIYLNLEIICLVCRPFLKSFSINILTQLDTCCTLERQNSHGLTMEMRRAFDLFEEMDF